MNNRDVAKNKYTNKMAALIAVSGGVLDDSGLFVLKPGCTMLNMTKEVNHAVDIYKHFNIDMNRPAYEQRAEFKSRITYLSFQDEPMTALNYNKKMAQEYQHLSVHTTQVEFLIAGVSIETCLEFVAHREANVARLTSSKTKAMDETLYRLQGNSKEQALQKEFILNFLQLKNTFEINHCPRELSQQGTEFVNMLNLSTKVNALTYSMNLKDYHKLFIGRLSHQGNETEVQEVCRLMCDALHAEFPLVIQSSDHYYLLNNGEKYKAL